MPRKFTTIFAASTSVLFVIGFGILHYYGPTAALIFAEFVSVPLAAGIVIDTRLKKKFSSEKGGWSTGIVVEGTKKVKIRVDWNSCMGAASCVELAPRNFRLDWEKKKSIFDPAPLVLLNEKSVDPERIFYAAQSCPYRAIILEDEETGERIYP